MLEWTGERFVPWARDAKIAYEHLHRYIWASTLVKDAAVLDLACGEGYGADLLARRAASVTGVDIDEKTIRHASEKYRRSNLKFLEGAITRTPLSKKVAFDRIVCFEALEHIEAHEDLLREVKRLLKPDGWFLVSTPNKEEYDNANEETNPFHLKELTFAEFDTLLKRHFANVSYIGQRVVSASSMWPVGHPTNGAVREYFIERHDGELRAAAAVTQAPLYFVAIATNGDAPANEASILIDGANEFASQLTEGLKWTRSQIGSLEATIASRDEALAWRTGQVEDLRNHLQAIQKDLSSAQHALEAIHGSRGWQYVLKLRLLRDRVRRIFKP